MSEVVFIDTSVLVELLDVPGKNGRRDTVAKEFLEYQRNNASFVLPVTTIIETGNHIAQVQGPGDLRRNCARRLIDALSAAMEETPPWVLTGTGWDQDMIRTVVFGSARRPNALALLNQGLGTGDIGILAEIEAYRGRIPSGTPIRLWTLDNELHLASYL